MVPYQGTSSAILQTLGWACPLFLHHVGRSRTTGTGSEFLFITVPYAIQHVAWLVVDQRAVLRDHGRDLVGSGASRDVCPIGAACRGVMVGWVVRKGIQLKWL